jgi:hypothetical protein
VSKNEAPAKYSANVELYQRMAHARTQEAKRPVSEKIATVKKLRDIERSLSSTRQANKALRKTKQVKISIKTR